MNPGPLTCEASALPLSYIPTLAPTKGETAVVTHKLLPFIPDEPTCDQVCFSIALGMPLFVVVTKVDKSSQEQVTQTTDAIFTNLLSEKGKVPFPVHSTTDVDVAVKNFMEGR